MSARVLLGDGALTLRQSVRPRSVDMVYMDPPFFTQQDWQGDAGSFSDRWRWDDAAAGRWAALPSLAAQVLGAMVGGRRDAMAYLAFMAELVSAARRTLKPTGTLWLHCDDTAHAWLRILCDVVFGVNRWWGEVVWKRTSAHNNAKCFGRVSDFIIVYARTGAALDRLSPFPSDPLREIDGVRGRRIDGYIDVQLNQRAKERVGYPTQKPLALLRELIEAGSRPGDTVVDPCCGSGTTIEAAWQLGRAAIGIDQSSDAVKIAEGRIGQRPFQADLFGAAA